MFRWKILSRILFLFSAVWVLFPGSSEVAAVESCYDRISATPDQPAPERVLYVLVDQTTPWTEKEYRKKQKTINPVSKHIAGHISQLASNWPKRGDIVSIITFSAISQGRDVSEVLAVQADGLPPESAQDRWRQSQIRAFKACFRNQRLKARIAIRRGIRNVLEQADGSIRRSEILQSMHRFTTTHLKRYPNAEITLLIASDFLENSSVMSFYRKGNTFEIDDSASLEHTNQARLIPDFRGAKVFGVGLGLGSDLFKSFKKTQSVADFWEGYFKHGKGNLIELGRPMLQRKNLD
uniref:VWFA domain-containing protein n=1 Tax=Candidatus Kentrum sp. FW TaxID=2126338 RepID=A0A450SHV9_9GAMM|nr:MAG: hypothetical protein BECKFW1821B_GA0114236_101312 [Candidatus Kentron sp. FW]VFJ56919.1 MAG: hypothetical protein BECKFW1821A_GA0114235_106513 [Candidatus Kentron sp. FW]